MSNPSSNSAGFVGKATKKVGMTVGEVVVGAAISSAASAALFGDEKEGEAENHEPTIAEEAEVLAELDGEVEAVVLEIDADGDGEVDAVLVDLDGDDIADAVAVDFDHDGDFDIVSVETESLSEEEADDDFDDAELITATDQDNSLDTHDDSDVDDSNVDDSDDDDLADD